MDVNAVRDSLTQATQWLATGTRPDDVSERALRIFASGAWNLPLPADYGPSVFSELWVCAKHLHVEESLLSCIQRLAIDKLPLAAKRIWYSQCQAAGMPAPVLRQLACRCDPMIQHYSIEGEEIDLLADVDLAGDLPLGRDARAGLSGIYVNQWRKLLDWSAEDRARIRVVQANRLDSYSRAYLSLLPEADTLLRQGYSSFSGNGADEELYLTAALTLPGKFRRIILFQNDLTYALAPTRLKQLLDSGYVIVLEKCRVSCGVLAALDCQFPGLLKEEHDSRLRVDLVSGRLVPSAPRPGTPVPSTPWQDLLLLNASYFSSISEQAADLSDLALPLDYRVAVVDHALERYTEDAEKCEAWIQDLAQHWEGLAVLPNYSKVRDYILGRFGPTPLVLLDDPANRRLLGQTSLELGAAIDRAILKANIFGLRVEKYIYSLCEHEGEERWRELLEAGEPMWRRVLALLSERPRLNVLTKLAQHVLANLGAHECEENSIRVIPSILYVNRNEPGLLNLLKEAPFVLNLSAESELEWACALAEYELNVTGIVILLRDTAEYLPSLLELFPRVKSIWVEDYATIGKANFPGIDVYHQSRYPLQNSAVAAGPARTASQYIAGLNAALESARLTRDGSELELRSGHASDRALTDSQFNTVAEIAIEALKEGVISSTAVKGLVARLQMQTQRRQDFTLSAAGIEIATDRRLFALLSWRAAQAKSPVCLELSSAHSLYTFRKLLEGNRSSDQLDLTPHEARELRQLCIDWNLPKILKTVEYLVSHADAEITLATYEEWESGYLVHLEGSQRQKIETRWVDKWKRVFDVSDRRKSSDREAIRSKMAGLMQEDSRRGALMRSLVHEDEEDF